jgi:hypothetical protein
VTAAGASLAGAVVLALAVAATPASAGPPSCKVSLSGAVQAEFACLVAVTDFDGGAVFALHADAPVPGIPSVAPGAFKLPLPVQAGTYTLDTLGHGKASVAAEGGTLYVASKTSSQRGEVTLTFTRVAKDARLKGAYVVHGSYRARLIPAGGGKQGEVVVEAKF